MRNRYKNLTLNIALSAAYRYDISCIRNLLKYHGLKGFVEKMKVLKAWALQLSSGARTYRAPWYSCRTYLGYTIPIKFGSVFKPLVRALIKSNTREIRYLLSILNMHHLVQGPDDIEITKKIKLLDLNIPNPSASRVEWCEGLLRYTFRILDLPKYLHRSHDIKLETASRVALSRARNGSYAQWLLEGRDRFWTSRFETEPAATDPSKGLCRAGRGRRNPETIWCGNLAVLGESGGKTRIVAVCRPDVQGYLLPLKEFLLRILLNLETDCTFRQEEGVEFLRTALKNGRKVHSLDLSDATWHFPISLQVKVLQWLGVPTLIRDLIKNGVYTDTTGRDHLPRKGQAMGLGPSFPLFALTHNVLLTGLAYFVGQQPKESFRVLGDDVIIVGDRLAEEYRKVLVDYEVPISEAKSFSSSSLGEFAGQVVYKGEIVTPIKWRELTPLNCANLFNDYAKILGKLWPIQNLVRSRLSRQFLAAIWPISRSLGGLGLKELAPPGNQILRLRFGYLDSLMRLINLQVFGEYQIKVPMKDAIISILTEDTDEMESPWYCESEIEHFREVASKHLRMNLRTKLGALHELSPNPGRTLSDFGYVGNLLPSRVKIGSSLRLSAPNGRDWNCFQNQVRDAIIEEAERRSSNESKEKTKVEECATERGFPGYSGASTTIGGSFNRKQERK